MSQNNASNSSQQLPHVQHFFDSSGSNTFSYVVIDPDTRCCAVIDSVLDFDQASGATRTTGADRIIAYIREHELTLEWILETHVHADHLSAAPHIQNELGGKLAIGSAITIVQETFGKIFNEGTRFERNGSQFDRLFEDQDCFQIGSLQATALHTPGHTPACMTYVIGDAVFVGDTLFMPDGGTARADFPGGDANTLYNSIHRILALPCEYRIFVCHDYAPNGRELAFETTVAREREENIHVNDSVSEEDFVSMRVTRDNTLGMPQLIFPSLQVNMRAGHFPPAEDSGQVFLKLPVNGFA